MEFLQWWVKLVKCLVKNKPTDIKKIIFEKVIMPIHFEVSIFDINNCLHILNSRTKPAGLDFSV